MPDPTDDLAVLQAILDLSPDLIALSEFSGAVLYVNPAGRALVGLDSLTDDEVLTTDLFFTVRGLLVADEVEASLRNHGHWRGLSELRHHRTDVAIPVAVSAFVLENHDGVPGKIATIIRDRTAGHHRDEELQAVAATARQHAAEQQALAELSRLAVHADLAQLMS
ncbi:MAG: PAS domain-containing protein, partial [Rhodococcus fascians]